VKQHLEIQRTYVALILAVSRSV